MQNSVERIVDEILVMDAQSGSREAFATLVTRWQKRLWWHALRVTGRTEPAWDITQDSWLDIVRGLRSLRDPGRFGAWAYRIVSNKARDWLYRNRRETEMEPPEMAATGIQPSSDETATDVLTVLCRLPSRSQVVLNLYYLEGFSLTEIAHILDVPEGTVKSRLHTARAEFRKLWESAGHPGNRDACIQRGENT